MNAVQKYVVSTLLTAGQLSETRRNLAHNPCVTKETTQDIYDHMMIYAEHIQEHISLTQKRIEALPAERTHRHADFDRTSTSGAASSSSNQHDQHATHRGDQPSD